MKNNVSELIIDHKVSHQKLLSVQSNRHINGNSTYIASYKLLTDEAEKKIFLPL